MDLKLSNKWWLFIEGTHRDYRSSEYKPLYNGLWNSRRRRALMIYNQMEWLGSPWKFYTSN